MKAKITFKRKFGALPKVIHIKDVYQPDELYSQFYPADCSTGSISGWDEGDIDIVHRVRSPFNDSEYIRVTYMASENMMTKRFNDELYDIEFINESQS